jgi:hypothetical protein
LFKSACIFCGVRPVAGCFYFYFYTEEQAFFCIGGVEDRVGAVRVIVDYSRIISTMVITSVGVVRITVLTKGSVIDTMFTVRIVSVLCVITRACMVLITIITVICVAFGATIAPHLTLVYVKPIVRFPASIITMFANLLAVLTTYISRMRDDKRIIFANFFHTR